jgi:hypothetical protein
MQKMSFSKGLCALVMLGMVITASLGCQSRRFYRTGNAAPVGQATTYEASPSSDVVQPATAAPTTTAPSGGCGPGCKSCGSRSLPILSRLQGYAPSSDGGSAGVQ